MKKLAIASASLALAAMPVVGVFAATEGSFKDEITVTVAGGCTIEVNGGTAGQYSNRTFSASIANGTAEVMNGEETGDDAPAMKVTCNTTSATPWRILATADNGGALKEDGGSHTIPSGNTFASDVSAFAYSLDGQDWEAVPTTANTEVDSGSTSSAAPYTFNPSYKVGVSVGQYPGTYEGGVTYTLALSA